MDNPGTALPNTIDKWMMRPGEMLRKWRKEMRLAQYDVAVAVGVSVSYISDIERGRTEPSLKTLRKLMVAAGVLRAR